MGEAADSQHVLVGEVVACWKRNGDLSHRASRGKMANVGDPKGITRQDVDANAELLEPILIKFGKLPAFSGVNMHSLIMHIMYQILVSVIYLLTAKDYVPRLES